MCTQGSDLQLGDEANGPFVVESVSFFILLYMHLFSTGFSGHHDPCRVHKPSPGVPVQFQVLFFVLVHTCPGCLLNTTDKIKDRR